MQPVCEVLETDFGALCARRECATCATSKLFCFDLKAKPFMVSSCFSPVYSHLTFRFAQLSFNCSVKTLYKHFLQRLLNSTSALILCCLPLTPFHYPSVLCSRAESNNCLKMSPKMGLKSVSQLWASIDSTSVVLSCTNNSNTLQEKYPSLLEKRI